MTGDPPDEEKIARGIPHLWLRRARRWQERLLQRLAHGRQNPAPGGGGVAGIVGHKDHR